MLKGIFNRLQLCCWQYGSIFIRLSVGGSQIYEISENSNSYNSLRSSKVIDLGANRKRICNFLLVINSNFVRISFRFRRPYNQYCVGADVKPCSINQSPSVYEMILTLRGRK